MDDRPRRLDLLRASLEELPRALAAAADVDRRPAPEDWSAREVIAHLADAELVYGMRLRLLLGTDSPHLQGYDEERWTIRFAPLDTVASALERWRALRESNLRLLDSLAPEEWGRTGLHSERGEESVLDQLVRMSDHDEGHLRQLTALA